MTELLNKKVPLYFTILLLTTLSALFYWQFSKVAYASKITSAAPVKDCPPANPIRYHLSGYSFINPSLFSDGVEESRELSGLKAKLSQMILQKTQTGELTSASVYLRMLENNKWISINDNSLYTPGSLVKVPVLMVYLHESEKYPGLLNKELYLDKSVLSQLPGQTFEDKTIQPGKSYKISFLLQRMVINSDNVATYLLNTNLDVAEFKKIFVDMGLPEPDVHNPDYEINASGYSRFFRVLYRSSYLNRDNSEYALKLLSQGEFKDGLLKNIPSDMAVAHKFGEYGKRVSGRIISQLHETGIFYYKDKPYLLTVMTRGNDVNVLPKALAEISTEVYHSMN